MIEEPAPRALVFDWDNTLVDSWEVIHVANSRTFEAMGLKPWTFEETRQNVAKSLREAFPDLFGDRWEEARDFFYATYDEIHLDYIRPLPGAGEALERFAELGLPLSVVSNKTASYLRKEVEALGWKEHFVRVHGAGDFERDKPDPMVVHAALGGNLADRGVWFISDNAIDMECGYRSGCTAVLMHGVSLPSDKERQWTPHLRYADFADLAAAVHALVAKGTVSSG